jgi:hypothetical protein
LTFYISLVESLLPLILKFAFAHIEI